MATRKKTPDPLAVSDEDEVMLAAEAETVQTAAKASFSLEDRLQGMVFATAKVLLFTDLAAATEWAEQDQRVQRLAAYVGSLEAGSPAHADALAAHNDADTLLEEKREAAFTSALAVHMRAVPQVAFEAAQRKARGKYKDESGQVPEDSREAFFEYQNELLLGQVVQRVVDASGNELTFSRPKLASTMRNALPVPQYQRLIEAFTRLVFNDSLARAATSDPGF